MKQYKGNTIGDIKRLLAEVRMDMGKYSQSLKVVLLEYKRLFQSHQQGPHKDRIWLKIIRIPKSELNTVDKMIFKAESDLI